MLTDILSPGHLKNVRTIGQKGVFCLFPTGYSLVYEFTVEEWSGLRKGLLSVFLSILHVSNDRRTGLINKWDPCDRDKDFSRETGWLVVTLFTQLSHSITFVHSESSLSVVTSCRNNYNLLKRKKES